LVAGGRIAGALAAGLRRAGDERKIIAYGRHPEKLRAHWPEPDVGIAHGLKAAVESAAMVIVAACPASAKEILVEVAACRAKPPQLCIQPKPPSVRGWIARLAAHP
jgi:pyrroline-5-carboxylate reductase